MSVKNLNKAELDFIKDEYNSGKTISEIAINIGFSRTNVRRALAEAGVINLNWYKTIQEHELLSHLKLKGITDINQLKGVL